MFFSDDDEGMFCFGRALWVGYVVLSTNRHMEGQDWLKCVMEGTASKVGAYKPCSSKFGTELKVASRTSRQGSYSLTLTYICSRLGAPDNWLHLEVDDKCPQVMCAASSCACKFAQAFTSVVR